LEIINMVKTIWQTPVLLKLDMGNETRGNGGAGTDFASEES
jgi:hypothetical protein